MTGLRGFHGLRRLRSAIGGVSVSVSVSLGLGLGLGLGISLSMTGCIVNRLAGPQVTGTCDGACAHYVQCKPGHGETDRNRCIAECPNVFSDRESLMAYESLSCDNAVEYVDGKAATTAAHR